MKAAAKPLRVAIVHDWMVSPGGAERLVLMFHRMWPEAPIYTAAYIPEKFPEFAKADVRPTWLDKVDLAKRKHQLFTIPRALAFKSLDLSHYDLVLSSSSAESKYVKTGPQTVHICYCHTPIRYYWSDYDWYRKNPPFGWLNLLAKVALPILIPFLRRMDYKAAQKVDYFIANSQHVAKRIKKYYGRESTVIYPGVSVGKFSPTGKAGRYYLILGRQVAYKRLDLAVDAFNELGLPLVVAGTGEEIGRQKLRSKDNIKYLGRVPDSKLNDLYAGAKAVIFPGEEDFGIVPVEAQAAGRPVVAYGKGGVLETVVEGKTGLLFKDQTAQALIAAVKKCEQMTFNAAVCRKQALQFDEALFMKNIKNFVDTHQKKRQK